MAKIKVFIRIDPNGNVKVTRNPTGKVKVNKDTLLFTSNRTDTAIKFKGSPFKELGGRRVLDGLVPAKGPFKVIKKAIIHFDCGHIVGGSFKQWAETGSDIPPC